MRGIRCETRMCLYNIILDDVSNALCFHYYFSSHKTRETTQCNGRKHFYPFSAFSFHGGSSGEGRHELMQVSCASPTCPCSDTVPALLALSSSFLFLSPATANRRHWRCLWANIKLVKNNSKLLLLFVLRKQRLHLVQWSHALKIPLKILPDEVKANRVNFAGLNCTK